MVTRGDDFDEFVRGTSTRLLRTAVLLTGDRPAAEDLVQEVYERVYVRWRWIRGAPEAYARKALTNLVANRWRSRGASPRSRWPTNTTSRHPTAPRVSRSASN